MIQVSFSGGRSSAMMAKIMIDNYPKDELIFTSMPYTGNN